MKKLRAKEDTLKEYALYLNTDSLTGRPDDLRQHFYHVHLVRALQIKNSFYYPFDSVLGISKLYAPDTCFRIFTWNITYDDYYSRQRGAIQFRTTDGSLKLIPLRDNSEFTDKPMDSVRNRTTGSAQCIIISLKHSIKEKIIIHCLVLIPTVQMSSKKWIEVMTFNEKNEPVFGALISAMRKTVSPKHPNTALALNIKKMQGYWSIIFLNWK